MRGCKKCLNSVCSIYLGKGKNPYLHKDELRNNAYDYSGSLGKVKISSLSACQ